MQAVTVKRSWASLTLQNDSFFIDPLFEQENFDLVSSLPLPDDAVFLDVGGHQGIWATFLSKLRPNGLVVTFEPHPNNLNYLHNNLRLIGAGNVLVAPFALGSSDSTMNLRCWDPSLKAGASGTSQLVEGDLPHYVIPTRVRRLDDLKLEADFIKIDVEHWEMEVLKGADDTLRRSRPRILVETHNTDTADGIRKFCEEREYKVSYHKATIPSLNLKSDYLWCEPL